MKENMDELLKRSLAPTETPADRLNRQILWKIALEEKKIMRKRTSRRKFCAAASLCILLLTSATAYAAYRYLTPAEAARELEDAALANAFESDGAIFVNETQESGGYRVTLLGSAAGKKISDYLSVRNGEIRDDRIYTVVAIERADGTPMPPTSSDDYGNEPFYVSHYVRGLDPKVYSVMSMGGGYSAFVQDGIEYRILEMDNLEMFADKGIYVGVNSGSFYDAKAYSFDETTGEIARNDHYDGTNALFVLPLDPSKADPEAAALYLEQLQDSWKKEDVPDAQAQSSDADAFMAKLTPDNLDLYAAPAEYTRMTATPDGGVISYRYEMESGAGGSGSIGIDELFPDHIAGTTAIGGYSSSGSLDTLNIEVFILNEDGTVGFVIYQPRL